MRTNSSEHRIDACASSLTEQINKNNRYATEEVKAYVKRVISEMDEDALNAMESSIPFYASKIRDKIEEYETAYRQKRFDDLIEMNKIVCRADGTYSFPKVITPSVSFDSLDKSLYTAECSDLNNFEFALIGNIVSLENVLWWHRVIDRRGFRLNGFINHYPDFIVKTKSGNIILVEAKGEQLKNDDSKAKLALGKKWDYMCGESFKYYMVFEKSDMQIQGSYTMDMGISKAYYKDNVTAFILLSSDSDFWGVISSLPDADFLVMVEEEKCGSDIQNALEQDGTYYCFMDDFCTGNIKTFKNAMFVSALKDEMEKALAVDTHTLIDDIIRNLRMDVSASEKSNFYNKYIRKMRLEIDDNGILKIKVQEE